MISLLLFQFAFLQIVVALRRRRRATTRYLFPTGGVLGPHRLLYETILLEVLCNVK